MSKIYQNTCVQCGSKFPVKSKQNTNPNNPKKFKVTCSKECLSALKSLKMIERHENGGIPSHTGIRTKLCRETLIQMFSYDHMLMGEIAKECGVKYATLSREFARLEIPRVFFRECPRCEKFFSCKMRCMVDPKSNKFKKYCSRACQLSSRNNAGTWIEREVETALTVAGILFEAQWQFGRSTVDFYIPGKKVAVEVNGDF